MTLNPLKRVGDMWREKWAPREVADTRFGGSRASTSHRWWTWLPLVLATAGMIVFFFLWYLKPDVAAEIKRNAQAKKFAAQLDRSEKKQAKLIKKRAVVRKQQKKEAENAKKILDDIDSAGGDFIKQKELRRKIDTYRRTGSS